MGQLNASKFLQMIKSDDVSSFKAETASFSTYNIVLNGKSGDTLLHLAARFSSLNIMKWMLNECNTNKVDVDARNTDGKSALHECALSGASFCAQLLLEAKATVDPLKRSDWTPLMLAAAKQHFPMVQLMVKSGANLRLRNKDGWTPFHIACREGNLQIIKYFLECDATLWSTKSNNNRTPLHTAALHGLYDTVHYLLTSCRYEPDERDSCGVTPFMDAVRSDHTDICQLLIARHSINPYCEDILGRSALHLAAESGSLKAIKYLLNELKFNVNGVCCVGSYTPLHLTAKEGHYEAIQLLLESGAQLFLTDAKGRTAYDVAMATKHFNCAQILNSNEMKS